MTAKPTSAADALAGVGRVRKPGYSRRRNILPGILFLLPLVSGVLVFKAYGFGLNLWMSFTEAGAFGPATFIGLDNFRRLIGDSNFHQAVINTSKFVVLGVPAIVIVALIAALMLNVKIKTIGLFRTILFLPAVTLPVALYMGFSWIFNTDYGIVNGFVQMLGGQPVNWFGTNVGVTTVFIVVMTYASFSVPMLVLLAGLTQIPESYYEAASIDGATPWKIFWHIKLPLLTPSIFYVATTNIITMFQMFSLVYIMLPESSAGMQFGQTIVHYYYQNAFVYSGSRGYAAALSIALFLMILIITGITFRLQKYWVTYDK
ncbi:MAG: sugar ABC transporter permease [Propionibacteriaceae bacterium]|nr:sugar ABC transporter permease [Propionibacteriaceae bacterium]